MKQIFHYMNYQVYADNFRNKNICCT